MLRRGPSGICPRRFARRLAGEQNGVSHRVRCWPDNDRGTTPFGSLAIRSFHLRPLGLRLKVRGTHGFASHLSRWFAFVVDSRSTQHETPVIPSIGRASLLHARATPRSVATCLQQIYLTER